MPKTIKLYEPCVGFTDGEELWGAALFKSKATALRIAARLGENLRGNRQFCYTVRQFEVESDIHFDGLFNRLDKPVKSYDGQLLSVVLN